MQRTGQAHEYNAGSQIDAPEQQDAVKPPADAVSVDECVVCLEEAKTHACIPCGHQCVCGTCAAMIVPNTPTGLCPLCRAPCVFLMDQSKVFK